jgi:membrane protein implicated in regulation of membrane protease activity
MGKFFKDNGLTIVLLLLFAGSILGHWLAGVMMENEELPRHGEEPISAIAFLADPQFLSTVFENWESEFLQMSAYVVLTAMLFQRGSAESKDPDNPDRDAALNEKSRNRDAPAALRMGAGVRWLYAHSLGIVLFILFILSFALHWIFSTQLAAEEARQHGEPAETFGQYLASAELWFESFQNWQSEFLSTAVLVVLSIWLRQRNSPESKPVTAPHSATGA